MNTKKTISVFEHQRLLIGNNGFTRAHLNALLRLNDYHNGKYFEPIAKGIKFNQYVGVVQVNGLTIEIHPKADKEDQDWQWKGVLLKMLKACGRLNAESSGNAQVRRQNLNLLEVYFELFLSEVETLIYKGLIKNYRKQTNNTKVLKGKLEFSSHIRNNIVRKERFYTTHQVYDYNHLLHQILGSALVIVSQFTGGTRLHDHANRVQIRFPKLNKSSLSIKQLNNVSFNRKNSHYQHAYELARLILLNYSPDITSGNEKMISILFNMNQLWEEFITKQLQKACANTAIIVSGQEQKPFLGSNRLKPDIILRFGTKIIIIDTKWKRPNKSSASVEDLRQMYTYCRFWNAKKAMLLYPGNPVNNNFQTFLTDDYIMDSTNSVQQIDHYCKMGFISVLDENGELKTNIGEEIIALLKFQNN